MGRLGDCYALSMWPQVGIWLWKAMELQSVEVEREQSGVSGPEMTGSQSWTSQTLLYVSDQLRTGPRTDSGPGAKGRRGRTLAVYRWDKRIWLAQVASVEGKGGLGWPRGESGEGRGRRSFWPLLLSAGMTRRSRRRSVRPAVYAGR